ncbi:uncharacterized protein JN550_005486 [Neoarthrinium moseri]|uniref:uncharacterized protein n=1 Tax=Neoarthrinium moseri TaxID=1658444 RepID=UPI001FDAF84C|nr:uncharacterized protein JN550_005486 [Neoarthrinium moseri]KAI1869896.1 hypothetical protein JN550_005486 [Neoarthrinium moseri]
MKRLLHKLRRHAPDETKPIPSFPDGVKVLHDCADAAVDICFVHGLTGDRENTWTARGQSEPWPKTLLPSRLANARILTYGYDAYVVRKGVAGSNRLIDHATNLLHDLSAERRTSSAEERPLIFIAHSMGGLVCKMAILRSRNNPAGHLRGIFQSTKGVLFLGTPHQGSWMSHWAQIPVSALGLAKSTNMTLLGILRSDNELLESIRVDFSNLIRELEKEGRTFEVTCFFEELPLPVVGKVVSKESATFQGHDPISIHANHSDMVKFASPNETGFLRLVGELDRWIAQIAPRFPEAVPQLSEAHYGCLRSLAFPTMHERFHNTERAIDGTCQWVLQHHAHRQWATCDRALLWIKGKPGSGKSTALKHILEYCEAQDNSLILSFFFHGRGHELLQKSPLGLFRALVHQVLDKAPESLPGLLNTFEQNCKAMGAPGEKWHWNQAELQRFFEASLPEVLKARPVLLFVDALDESGQENAVNLVETLKSLVKSLPTTKSQFQLRVCFSCRHWPILDVDGAHEICLEDENEMDISTYIMSRLTALRHPKSSSISALITDRASGIFMWARLVVDRVLRLELEGAGFKDIEAAIHNLPQALDDLYREIIGNMKPASLKLIQWVLFAQRPLPPVEMRWAVLIDPECPYTTLEAYQSAEGYDNTDTERMCRQITSLSCGLVEVIGATYSRSLAGPLSTDSVASGSIYALSSSLSLKYSSSEDREVVQFIHQSVKDFIVEKGLRILKGGSTEDEAAAKAHLRLSRICIHYLRMEEITQAINYEHDVFPFLHYAATSWVAHATQCDRHDPQEDLLDLFSWPSNSLMEVWIRAFRELHPYRYYWPAEGTRLIHIMGRYGMLMPLTAVLTRMDQNVGDTNLLSGANVDTIDDNGRTALSWAASNGQEGVVHLLIESGADLEVKDNDGQTPLSWVASNGQEGVVHLLIESGADLEVKDNDGQTPLSWAASYGQEGVVRLLIESGADLEAKDNDGQTPLSWAASNGQEGVVRLLIESGADLEAKDNFGRTPLSWAASNGQEGVVRLLIESGADLEAKDNFGRTPLSRAANYGQEGVVHLLIKSGADLNTKDSLG